MCCNLGFSPHLLRNTAGFGQIFKVGQGILRVLTAPAKPLSRSMPVLPSSVDVGRAGEDGLEKGQESIGDPFMLNSGWDNYWAVLPAFWWFLVFKNYNLYKAEFSCSASGLTWMSQFLLKSAEKKWTKTNLNYVHFYINIIVQYNF